MVTVLTVLHILVCLVLVVAVLIQSGSSGGLSGLFGGGSQSVFGNRGAGTFLTKLTTILAISFFITTLLLTVFGNQGQKIRTESPIQQQSSN